MKELLHELKRITAISMIFFLMIQQFGCVNSSILTTDNLPSYSPNYAYAVHCHKLVYIMEKIQVTNDTLSGKIYNPDINILQNDNFIHIYPSSDSIVKINTEKILSLPLQGIKSVKSIEEAPGKTTGLVIGGVVLVLLIAAGISLSSTNY
jgi:hypothetical protein